MKVKLTMKCSGLTPQEQGGVMERMGQFLDALQGENLVEDWNYEVRIPAEEV